VRVSLMDIGLFVVYCVTNATALLVMKRWIDDAYLSFVTGSHLGPLLFFLGGAVLYVVSFSLWVVILARNDLSLAFPIAVSATLVLTTVLGVLTLGETLMPMRIAGIAIILIGIWLVSAGA